MAWQVIDGMGINRRFAFGAILGVRHLLQGLLARMIVVVVMRMRVRRMPMCNQARAVYIRKRMHTRRAERQGDQSTKETLQRSRKQDFAKTN
jgi:hypothetical protein